jgi:hypothetical protein
MYNETISDSLVEAQTKCFNVQTDQIVELMRNYEDNDEVIKKLIDERRWVYGEFSKRIDAAIAAERS